MVAGMKVVETGIPRELPRVTPICEVDGLFFIPGWVGADRAQGLYMALLEGRAFVEGGYIVLYDDDEWEVV